MHRGRRLAPTLGCYEFRDMGNEINALIFEVKRSLSSLLQNFTFCEYSIRTCIEVHDLMRAYKIYNALYKIFTF